MKFYPKKYIHSKNFDFKLCDPRKVHLRKKEFNDQYRLKSGADSVCSELRTFHAGLVLYKSTQSGHAPSVGDPVFGKTP